MDNNTPLPAGDVPAPRNDRSRILRAFNVSLAAVLVLVAVFALQGTFDWRPWAVAPLEAKGLLGLVGYEMTLLVDRVGQLLTPELRAELQGSFGP